MTAPHRQQSRRQLVVSRIKATLFAAMESFAIQEEANIVGLISTPWPPASKPGTPPHMRTGALAEGVGHHTEGDDRQIVTTMYSNRPPGETDENVPVALEFGSVHPSGVQVAARPYMSVSKNDARRSVLNHVANALRNVSV